jgi:hypothetical protein
MKGSLLTFILLVFILLSGSLIVTASPMSFNKQFEYELANEEEPEPWRIR